MLGVMLCVLCAQFGENFMVTQHAGDHPVLNSLEECVSVTECPKSSGNLNVPLRTISVTCSPSAMVVHVKADLFDLGVPVNPKFVTLGERCGVTEASSKEFIIHTTLTDCGTRYRLTAESLIYTNVLVYAPFPSVHGVIRQEMMSVPVHCVYRRRLSVDSVSIVPSWLPHLSAHSTEHTLHFSLHLMATDWQDERGVYFLGDVINMEVSVFAPLLNLRVFVQDCVAMTSHDVKSVPRHKFIQNGCFTDGQQTSSVSRFLPRIQPDKLYLQLHTFIFRQVNSTKSLCSMSKIFISCRLKADLQSSSSSRVCSYIQGSWRSADGDHSVCESCQMSNQYRQEPNVERRNPEAGSVQMKAEKEECQTPEPMWKTPEQAYTHGVQVLKQVQIGPLSVSSWRSEMPPPTVLEGVHITYVSSLKTKRLTAHTLQGNISTPGSEYELSSTEKNVEWASSVSAEGGTGPSIHTAVPWLPDPYLS